VGTAIRRDHVINRVNGNPHPFAIHFDFVVVLNHSTLSRATIQQVAARTFAVISLELRVAASLESAEASGAPIMAARSIAAVRAIAARPEIAAMGHLTTEVASRSGGEILRLEASVRRPLDCFSIPNRDWHGLLYLSQLVAPPRMADCQIYMRAGRFLEKL
jgi:hypothetical protein